MTPNYNHSVKHDEVLSDIEKVDKQRFLLLQTNRIDIIASQNLQTRDANVVINCTKCHLNSNNSNR